MASKFINNNLTALAFVSFPSMEKRVSSAYCKCETTTLSLPITAPARRPSLPALLVMDIIDCLFVEVFDTLNKRCSKELEVINKIYPFENIKYLRKTLRLTLKRVFKCLSEVGIDDDHFKNLNIETEQKLGQLVLRKYGTEFYILHRYPLTLRPFYTKPCVDDSKYSNSFDVFLRGKKFMTGAQHIHEHELLAERARACGMDVNTISTYIDCFRYGTPPHGGFGGQLKCVVKLFCALDDIHETSLFPRDSQRLEP
ncbi:Aspartate--tRNA ligase 2, cytoplasmic [Orobanche hederae]